MLRLVSGGVMAGMLLAAVSVAVAEKPAEAKGKNVTGGFEKYQDGVLSIKVKGKKGEEPKVMDYKVAEDLKAAVWSGEDKKDSVAKDALKDLKTGTTVTVSLGEGDKVASITVGAAPKPKTAEGTFEKYDGGILTLKVKAKKGDEPKSTDYKVAEDFKTFVWVEKEKKEMPAKDAFKDAKTDTKVKLTFDKADKVTDVLVGTKAK